MEITLNIPGGWLTENQFKDKFGAYPHDLNLWHLGRLVSVRGVSITLLLFPESVSGEDMVWARISVVSRTGASIEHYHGWLYSAAKRRHNHHGRPIPLLAIAEGDLAGPGRKSAKVASRVQMGCIAPRAASASSCIDE